MKMLFSFKRWQVALPLLMLLLYLVFSSYRLLVADINHQHVNRYLEHWKQEFSENKETFVIPESEINVALRNAGRALSYQADDPLQLLLMAKVYQWLPFVEAGASLAEPEYYELDLIRKAVALRPAWPYGWMLLVEAKARHRQIDEEFNRSLVQAITLGPWEREVMERAARLGHYYQGRLTPEAEVMLEINSARLSKAYPRLAARIAREAL